MCFPVLTLYTRTMYFSLSAFSFREDSTTLTVLFVFPPRPPPRPSPYIFRMSSFSITLPRLPWPPWSLRPCGRRYNGPLNRSSAKRALYEPRVSLRPAQGATSGAELELPNSQPSIHTNVAPTSDFPPKFTWATPAVMFTKRVIDSYVEMYTRSGRYIIPYLSATALFRVNKYARYHLWPSPGITPEPPSDPAPRHRYHLRPLSRRL